MFPLCYKLRSFWFPPPFLFPLLFVLGTSLGPHRPQQCAEQGASLPHPPHGGSLTYLTLFHVFSKRLTERNFIEKVYCLNLSAVACYRSVGGGACRFLPGTIGDLLIELFFPSEDVQLLQFLFSPFSLVSLCLPR